MRRCTIPAVALALVLIGATATWGQVPSYLTPTPAPDHKYPVTPQAGEWLICVQTFKEAQVFADETPAASAGSARTMAEEMVEYIQRQHGLSAYIFERGHTERMAEAKRIQEIRDKHWDAINKMRLEGLDPARTALRYRTTKFPYEYAVLVGKKNRNLKDMDSARDFLADVRKLKPPPEKFCSSVVVADVDPDKKDFNDSDRTRRGYAYLNPFLSAMVAHNPTIEFKRDQEDPTKADKFMKELNADEEFSVLKCSKPFTLMVKIYQGQATLITPKGPTSKSWLGKSARETLGACGAQAHETAAFLRKMKPSFEAYVLHCRQYSLVAVGQYDGENDPNLIANQKTLAGLQLKIQGGAVIETLNSQPVLMRIPR